MTVNLRMEHHLKFLSLKGGCTDWSESTLVKMLHCWKRHVVVYRFVCVLIVIVGYSLCPVNDKDIKTIFICPSTMLSLLFMVFNKMIYMGSTNRIIPKE